MRKSSFAVGLLFAALGVFSASCDRKLADDQRPAPATELELPAAPTGALSAQQLSDYLQQVQQHNQQSGLGIDWNKLPDNVVFAGVEHGHHVLTVGYHPAGQAGKFGPGVSLTSGEWATARQTLLDLVLATERQRDPSLSAPSLQLGQSQLPFFTVICRNPATITRLRQAAELSWLMPSDYTSAALEEPVQSALNGSPAPATDGEANFIDLPIGNSFGCQNYAAVPNLRLGADFNNRPVSNGNAMASWNYKYHFIEDTWDRGFNGRGVRLFIIDTGVSRDQPNFGPGGAVTRTINRFATLGTDAHDLCGHGTTMAGAAGASLRAGTSVGVAFGSDMTIIRAMNDVVISTNAESRAVADAIRAIADRPGRTNAVVSMSIGGPFVNNIIDEAFTYLNNGPNRDRTIFFAAAGTSNETAAAIGSNLNWGALYPANRADVYSVTGYQTYPQWSPADRNVRTFGVPVNRCLSCIENDAVDFGIVMNKAADYRVNGFFGATNQPLTQAAAGNVPATVGGSSVATAQMAGIAALVWQRYPNMSRADLHFHLRNTGRLINSPTGGTIMPNAFRATN